MALHASACQLFYFLMEWFFQQLVRLFQGPSQRTEENVEGKVIVITGANSGLGKYASEELAKRGARVVMACRNMEQGQAALEEIKKNSGSSTNVDLVQLDLADLSSIRKCAASLKENYPVIDVLVNNAGISLNGAERQFTKDGFEMHFGTNHLGHFLLTNLLLDNIKKSSYGRIITVSSTTGVMTNLNLDNLMMENVGLGLGNTMPYNNSKFANALFSKELSKKLKGTHAKSFSVCPGLARSNIFQHYSTAGKIFVGMGLGIFGLPVEKAGDIILYCALAKEISESSGEMYRFGKKFSSIEPLLKEDLATDLWKASETLVGI